MNVPYPSNYFSPEDDKPEVIELSIEEKAKEFSDKVYKDSTKRFMSSSEHDRMSQLIKVSNYPDKMDLGLRLMIRKYESVIADLLDTIQDLYIERQ